VSDINKKTGEIKEQVVHILKEEHLGERMCIDEKMINGRYSTIMSNQDTGHIALLIDNVKPALVKAAIHLFDSKKLENIKHICADMSPVIISICRETMPNANIVIDKFHVIKHVLDALMSVRLDIKKSIKIKAIPNEKNPNGWTDLELLEKTRYLLYKHRSELEPEQEEMLNLVFQKYSTLETAYELTCDIRLWYNKSNIGKSKLYLENQLEKWQDNVMHSKIVAFKPIDKMFENHKDDILRYFEKGLTNAKAENINGRIQRFLQNNYGTRNRDFFFYRIQIYFAPAPQKKN
jgi:transposase